VVKFAASASYCLLMSTRQASWAATLFAKMVLKMTVVPGLSVYKSLIIFDTFAPAVGTVPPLLQLFAAKEGQIHPSSCHFFFFFFFARYDLETSRGTGCDDRLALGGIETYFRHPEAPSLEGTWAWHS
jgi:hypothetical protein